jgi:hypothetical protein
MKAAWYEKQGAAGDVLTIGEMDDPQPLSYRVYTSRLDFVSRSESPTPP